MGRTNRSGYLNDLLKCDDGESWNKARVFKSMLSPCYLIDLLLNRVGSDGVEPKVDAAYCTVPL